jgi:hypothetical protein
MMTLGLFRTPSASTFAEVEIERQNNARIPTGTLDDFGVRRALHAERPNVNRFVTKLC